MELRLYWAILRRRLLLPLALAIIAVTSYAVFPPARNAGYSASMRFTVGLRPEASSGTYYTYDRYYTWLTAEYLLDDLAEVVKSQVFAQDVAAEAGLAVSAGAIHAATAAGKLHRILTVTVRWPNRDELVRMSEAVTRVLTERGATYFAQLSADAAVVALIDPPSVSPVAASLRQRLELPVRLLLALIVGVGLAFLVDYLDDSVRDRADLESLDVPVLGEVPAARRWPAGITRHRSQP